MMAALFLLMTLTIAAVYFSSQKRVLTLFIVTLALCALMFWHHITETLQINW